MIIGALVGLVIYGLFLLHTLSEMHDLARKHKARMTINYYRMALKFSVFAILGGAIGWAVSALL